VIDLVGTKHCPGYGKRNRGMPSTGKEDLCQTSRICQRVRDLHMTRLTGGIVTSIEGDTLFTG